MFTALKMSGENESQTSLEKNIEEILSRMKKFGEELDIVKGNTELLIEIGNFISN